NGVINANGANALIIVPTGNGTIVANNGGGMVNQGLMKATGNGGLVLATGIVNNNGGTIRAEGARHNVYLQSNTQVRGGTLATTGGGKIVVSAGHIASLDGISQGTLNNTGTIDVTNNSTLVLGGTINNTGTIGVNAVANGTELRFADGAVLTG